VTEKRRVFIGDVHGHYDGLMNLMDAIAPRSGDNIYFLGDLIDRGPKSAQVLEFVRHSSYTCLLGNHEQLLLDAFPNGKVHPPALQAWLYSGGHATITSYNDPEELLDELDWLRTLPTHLDLGDIWLAHAGVHPGLEIEVQTAQEFCWIREPFHSSPKPFFPDKVIITGHTITFTLPRVSPGAIARGRGWLGIDTGVYHPRSGWLTGLDMTTQRVYQANVFTDDVRVLPLEEVVVDVNPDEVASHRRFSLMS
jgi:serine/threonine protein phosphatase 1